MGFNARVALEGTAFELVVKYPKTIIVVHFMPKKWLSDLGVWYEKYHL